jgi:hypothetical protein
VLYFLRYAMTDQPATPIPGQPRDVSISMTRVNLLALPAALITLLVCTVPFVLVHGWSALAESVHLFLRPGLAIPVLLVGFVLHELIHGAAWAFYGQKPLTIMRFGINWSALSPYAHCPEPMEAGAYRLGALAPGVLLGLTPVAAALWGVGPTWLFFAGLIFSLAAAGDVLILWVLRAVPSHFLVLDHPSRAGCFVYEPMKPEEPHE